MGVEAKVAEASRLLREAYTESECKWCSRNLKELAEITEDLSVVLPYTDEAAKHISSLDEKRLKEIGGKTKVLKAVVDDSLKRPKSERIYNDPPNKSTRGAQPMDKQTAMYVVGSQLALGTGLGFVLNRADEKWMDHRAGQGKSTEWFYRLAPAVNIVGGAVLTILGVTGKVLRGKMEMVGVAGGGVMIANGALQYLEEIYKSGGTAGKPVAYKPAKRAPSRAPSALPPVLLDVKSY